MSKKTTKFYTDFVWNIPEQQTLLPGRIKMKNGQYYLELFSKLTLEGCDIATEGIKTQYFNYPIIIGSNSGELNCTLRNVKWAGTKRIGDSLFRIRYSVEFIFNDVSVKNESDLLVMNGFFSVSGLETWYDGSASVNRLSSHTGEFAGVLEMPRDTSNKRKVIKVTDNISFSFIDIFDESPVVSNFRKLTFKKYLQIDFATPIHFSELLSTMAYFAKLLSVSSFKKTFFKIHSVRFTDNIYAAKIRAPYQPYQTYIRNNTLHKGNRIQGGFSSQHYMMISRWSFDEQALDDVIRIWFANQQYSHVYDYFIDSHFWSVESIPFVTNVMFNNRFLNMLHALEAFHELYYGKNKYNPTVFYQKKADALKCIKDPSLKQWVNNTLNPPKFQHEMLKDKLSHLFDELDLFLKFRFNSHLVQIKNFLLTAVTYRNVLSHGSQKSTYQGEEFNKLFLAVQYLLALCILKSLNINSIQHTIASNVRLNQSASEVLLYLKNNVDKYNA